MPRIIFDTDKIIDLPIGPESIIVRSRHEGSIEYSGSGVYEAVSQYGIDEIMIDVRFQEAAYRQLYNWWWTWARHRRVFALAMDTTKMASTTLDGSAAAGQKVVPVTATTGLVAGDSIQLRSATTAAREIHLIASVSSGVSVTTTENLLGPLVSGDICRHNHYFPSLICTDEDFEPKRSGLWYSHTFGMIEAYSHGYLDADGGVLEL